MPDIHLVMSTLALEGDHLQRLREALAPAELVQVDPRDDAAVAAALERADVALLARDVDDRLLAAPRLRWIHCDHAGLDRSARPEIFERGLMLTGSAGRSAPAVAEHALFFMLALAYDYPAMYADQRERRWNARQRRDLRGLSGRSLGIVGLGHTGRTLALRAKAMGMRVLGYRRGGIKPPGVDALYSAAGGDTLEPLLREADFLVLALPLTDATHHLLGAAALALMQPSAYLINVGRGAVVDEQALIAALRGGRLAGAGLDVFESEPLPTASPLWDMPNVLITPHTTPQVPDRTGRSLDIIRENIRRYRTGEPMLNELTAADVYTRGNENRQAEERRTSGSLIGRLARKVMRP